MRPWQVRAFAYTIIVPGITLIDMCEQIENMTRTLVVENGLEAGIGFPTGCSINHCAAHFTPNGGDKTVLQAGDVMKVRAWLTLYKVQRLLTDSIPD